ncbi:MAG TPA: hypothetical protein EYH34_05775 [Planctomycetes bacterium]|nr:hypothetical protein [Planctomycetota bacterium]
MSQEHSPYHTCSVGASMRWSPKLETFVRYRGRSIDDPLFAIDKDWGATNTAQPEREDLIEVGGTWTPVPNFLANVTAGIDNRDHDSEITEFEENDYPITCTLWYAPTPRWSLTAGYGFYSNWIDQQILFPSDDPTVEIWDRRRWSHRGRMRLLSLGTAYAWSTNLTLSGGLEMLWGRNTLDPLEPWPDLPGYINVVVNKTRYTAGVDWTPRPWISACFRYIFDEYEDESASYLSGTAHMFLAGASLFR